MRVSRCVCAALPAALVSGLALVFSLALTVSAAADTGFRTQLPLRSIGPAGMSGRITAIAVDETRRDRWLIGTASGGLWQTRNAGTTFEPLFDEQAVQSIGAVALAPGNPDLIYVGTGEGNPRNSQASGNGVYRSRDGGRTWKYLGLPDSRNIHRILVHPRDADTLWLGVLGDPFKDSPQRGVYKSTDGGETWRRVLFSNARSGIGDLVMDPQNPDRLFAALWEYRRTPWDSFSGGPGSGLYRSDDGGETWAELDETAGLPPGPLGRIGLGIARSRRDRIYALVEAEENALYRSDDGGLSWSAINSETIGSRPFYFAEVHVDPLNENRIYNLYSRLARSEDGGESFEVIEDWGREVHADYHAFWIDPQNSDFIIAGTDGGLYWTRDRGKNWRFAENLPLGQFYHLTVDDELPYNVYGGLQDNGTWYGPSEVWRRGGLRNAYWRELAFNDGFDVVLDGEDPHTVYALWQAGMLVRIDRRTGQRKTIAPVDSQGSLRFNWNAAIARDPFAAGTLYIGSQYLHRSRDRGATWERISDDLTTNDPSKQRQSESGGLSRDATGAENHTTLTAIAPSAARRDLIWAGSDDGRLHHTRDGGKSWNDVSRAMKGVPEGSWIRQIHPSRGNPAEAFVVVDNHLRGDWSAYLLHTQDYGRTWKNLLKDADLPAYALSFVQDPAEPRLMFVGTEFGLYLSLDAGGTWAKWDTGFPSVSTMDLQIQERERDLVVASFGRSIWILDDLKPWRELARDPGLQRRSLHLFAPPPAYQVVMDQAVGQRLTPDHLYTGENNARQALLSFWVGESVNATATVSIERGGETLRRWSVEVVPGLNRTAWDLQEEGEPIYGPLMSPDLEMPLAAPGIYRVRIELGETAVSSEIEVLPDPRVAYDASTYAKNREFRRRLESLQTSADEARRTLVCAEEALQAHAQAESGADTEALRSALNAAWEPLDYYGIQGTVGGSSRLMHRLSKAFYFTHSPYEALSENDHLFLESLERQSGEVERSVEAFLEEPWAEVGDGPREGYEACVSEGD